VGDRFTIGAVPATLVAATQQGKRPGPTGRLPFSLEFEGPAGAVMPQGAYCVAHDELGAVELFLVPVAADADGVRYEAVFS